MNPAILARLFQAHTDALQHAQHSEQPGGGEPPLDLQQEPGALQWGQQGGGGGGGKLPPIDLNDPNPQGDPGAMESRMQSIGDMTLPPSDYKYLDRVEDDGKPLGVMFDQQAGQPGDHSQNVPMSDLPPGAQGGDYISPLDIHHGAPPSQGKPPMGAMFDDPETAGVQWGPNPYPSPQQQPPMTHGRRMSTRR